jgi:hypothetical protein
MGHEISRRSSLRTLAAFAALPLASCGTWIRYEDIGEGDLQGRCTVEWYREDYFIYRKHPDNPLSFRPSFMTTPIVPENMYTDGGSIPRVFWSIPSLSPWGLGPAYVIHDWIFEMHRCHRPVPPEVAQITFEQSARILAEVGKALIEHGLVKHNLLEEIVWAVRTRYARGLWDQPGDPASCRRPSFRTLRAKGPPISVVDFVIPPKR